MASVLNDVKYAARMWRQSPGFVITAVGALALGMGANTAIFTVIHTVVFQPLPYPDADHMVNVGRPMGGQVSEPLFSYWLEHDIGLADVAAYHAGASMNLGGGDKPEVVPTIAASKNYFRLFGARPLLGRTFSSAEDTPGGPRVMVLSYGLWKRHFSGDFSIAGKTATLGGAAYTIVGVLSAGFWSYPAADVWIPLQADLNSTNVASTLTVSGRMPLGTTLGQVNARVEAIDRRYAETHTRELRIDPGIRAVPMEHQIVADIRPRLFLLFGAVGLVLLIACANVSNLLLARAAARRKEMAVRAALGAQRGRIIRQLLTESLLLGLAGGAAALALGYWSVRGLLAIMPGDLPRLQEIAAVPALDPTVSLFTLLIAFAASGLFGLFPAFQLAGTQLSAAFNESDSRGGRKHNRVQGYLVSAEMAIAVVLLCGALLLIRSFAALHNVDPGFDPHNVLTMQVSLAGPGYSKSKAVDEFAREFVNRTKRIPGVEDSALASALPLWGMMDMIFNIPGRTPRGGGQITGDVQWRFVSPAYFDVLRIPLVSGRLLRDGETGRTVVISQTMARRYWPGTNPVGQIINIGQGLGPAYRIGPTEIVGIVGDVRERLFFEPSPIMYQSPRQIPDADMALLNGYEPGAILVRVRPGVAPMSVSPAVQEALLASGQISPANIRTLERAGLDSTARQNSNLLLLGLFAAMALLLAAVGIYGVMSYAVEQRTHEIGVRAALGASRRDTLRLILSQVLRLTAAGAGVGVLASLALGRLLRAELFEVKPSDPLTLASVPLILLAVALAAAAIPALRATRIDPVAALRHE